MKITIKTLKNKKFDLEVQDDETIGQIKQRIEHELKLGEAASQKLIHSGHILKDDQTVSSAKIMNGDFLVVMVSGAKPGKKEDEPAAPAPAVAPPAQPAPVAAPVAPAPAAAAPASVPPAAAPAQPAPAQAPAAANAAPANAAQAAASNLVMGPAYEEMVNNLMALGFPRDQVVAALRASFNNPDRAAQYLFGGIPDELLAAQAQQPQAGAAAAARGAPPAQAAHAHPAQGDEAGDMEHEHEHENDEDAEMDEEALAGLQNAPELQQLRQLMQQNPAIIPMLLQQLQQSNPQLMQAFGNNPEALLALLGAAGGGGGGGGGGAPPQGGPGRPHVIQITPEEKRSIDNLEALGFSRRRALEAFLICDRNEELAANYLFDQGNDPEELPQAPPGRQGQGGGGNPPAGGH